MIGKNGEAPTGPAAKADRITGRISHILSVIASTTIMATMVLITADVASRTLFSWPINGVSDFVAFSIVACVFLQLGSTVRGGRLISAEFLMAGWQEKRPLLAHGANALFNAVAALLLFRALTWLTGDFVKAYETGQFTGAVGAYQIVLWPFKLAVAIGCAVALYETVRQAVLHGRRFFTVGAAASRPTATALRGLPSWPRRASPSWPS